MLYISVISCLYRSTFVYCPLRVAVVINTIVEPSGIQAGALAATSTSQTRPSARDKKPAGRPLGDRTRGGASSSNANESTNRSSRGGAGGGGGHHMS